MGRSRSRDRRDRDRRDRSRERRSRSRDRGGKSDKKKDDRSPEKKEEPTKESEELAHKPGKRVTIVGLQKNPEKNGAVGTLAEFNKDKGRWLVDFSSGTSNNFKEENLEVMPDNDAVDDNEEVPTAKVYITNIHADVVDKDLIDLFSKIGMLAKEPQRRSSGGVTGFPDQWPYAAKVYKPGRSNGDGCAEYVDKMAAKAAIKTYNGYKLKGTRIKVEYAGVGRKYDNVELTLPWAERPENQGRMGQD